MEEIKPSLVRRLREVPIDSPEAEALRRRLLRSLARGAGDSHLLAARALFGATDHAEDPEKTLLFDQVVFCLTRALEDFAMLGLMDWDENRHALEVYLSLDRPELRAFYARCRRGLMTDDQVARVALAGPAAALKRMKTFKETPVNTALEPALEWAGREARSRLSEFGRLYHASPDEADPYVGAWQLAYAKAPIGMKLLNLEEPHDADKSEKTDAAHPNDREMLLGVESLPDNAHPGQSKICVSTARVRVDLDLAENVLFHIQDVCAEIRRLAELKLLSLEQPAQVFEAHQREYMVYLREVGARKKHEAEHELSGSPEGPLRIIRSEDNFKPEKIKNKSESQSESAPKESEESASNSKSQTKDIGGVRIIHSMAYDEIKNQEKNDSKK